MADLSLKYLLYGEDRTASKSIKGVGTQAQSTGSQVSGALGRLGSVVGGEVGDMLSKVSAGFDQVGEHTKGMSGKMIAGGSAIAGLGVAMQMMASKDIAAHQQLDAAVEATGKGYEGFGEDVDRLIEKQVSFGHTNAETTTALRVLTQAYGDPTKALGEMNLVTDLAAAKHISLEAAATAVGKAHGGAGKIFKEFGIVVGKNADGTKNYDGALTDLSGKLTGQASASMDTFGGHVTQVKTWLENQASAISEKLGPALTVAGPLIAGVGSVMQVMATRAAAAAAAGDAAAASSGRMSGALKGVGKAAGAAVALAAVAAVMGAIEDATHGAVPGVEATTAALIAAGDAAATGRPSIQGIDDLFKGIGSGDTWSSPVDNLTQAFRRLTDKNTMESLNDQTDALLHQGDAATRSAQVFENLGQGLAKLVSSGHADEAAKQFDAMTAKLGLSGDAVDKLRALMPAYGEAVAGAANETDLAATSTHDYTGDIKANAEAVKAKKDADKVAADAEKALGDQVKAATDKVKASTDAIHSYSQAMVDAGLKVLSTRDAQRNLIQSVADAGEALKKNGKTLDINTQKGRDNAAALDAQAGKAISLATSIYDETHSESKMRDSLVKSRDALVKTAEHFGMSKDAAGKYADQVLKIPSKATTAVLIKDAAKAIADAKAIQAKLDALKNPVTITVNTASARNAWSGLMQFMTNTTPQGHAQDFFHLPGKAAGGPVAAGVPYLVGEKRPEVFVPDTAGTILPSVPTSGGSSGGGGAAQPLLVQFLLDGRVLHQSLLALKRTSGGGLALG